MSTSSFQMNYTGQTGWNDCIPVIMLNKRVGSCTSISSNASQQSGSKRFLTPTPVAPPPARSASASSVSVVSIPLSEESRDIPELVVMTDQETENETENSPAEVLGLLDQVLAKKSTLSARELAHYEQRLQKILPGLEQAHLVCIQKACSSVLATNDIVSAREAVVQHSLYHSGVSSWVLPLRRIIESVSF